MRKIFVMIVLISVLVSSSLFSPVPAASENDDVVTISKSIKALANAVELWANAHKGKYPTSGEFYTDEFLKYVKKADVNEFKNSLRCPLSGRYFNYQRLQSTKDYIISCPRPYQYGMKSIYYQRSKGVVIQEPAK
ncbi:MAG: hypothetical protein RDV48_19005 [Candidatus Eremiobacteraeota bacterium]|nr:hypothetical protein [Candidatus Eremiobacteraeota bacterium]